jgi:hypothetical protein
MTPPATAPTATDASTGGARRPTREPDPAAPPPPLATEVVARLPHRDTAIRGFVTRIMPSIETCVPDERAQRLEVLRRPADVRMTRDEHVGRCISHYESPLRSAARGLNEAQMFCRELTS